MEDKLKLNLDYVPSMLDRDNDFWMIICGPERAGKSTLGKQIAYYLDPTFNHERIGGSSENYIQVVLKEKGKRKAFLWDEAGMGGDAIGFASKENKMMRSFAEIVGYKNHIHILCLPSFYKLSSYFAVDRSAHLIQVVGKPFRKEDGTPDFLKGKFRAWGRRKKNLMYTNYKKRGKLFSEFRDYAGKFNDFSPINEAAYMQKKEELLMQFLPKEKKKEKIDDTELIKELLRRGKSVKEIQSIVNKSHVWIYEQRKRLNLEEEETAGVD
jgi:hypothetical protein